MKTTSTITAALLLTLGLSGAAVAGPVPFHPIADADHLAGSEKAPPASRMAVDDLGFHPIADADLIGAGGVDGAVPTGRAAGELAFHVIADADNLAGGAYRSGDAMAD